MDKIDTVDAAAALSKSLRLRSEVYDMPKDELLDGCGCPIMAFQKIISGKYKVRILWDLQDGPLRYSEVKRGLLRGAVGSGEVAPRVLSRELKALTEAELIVRKDF